MYILKFFGDKHEEPTAIIALKLALPILKQHGYDTLFIECPYEDAGIDDFIDYTNESISIITLFPDGIVPAKLTNEQKAFIKKMLPHYDNDEERYKRIIKKIFDHEKDFLEHLKQRIEMLKTLKALGMRLVTIDVRRPLEYCFSGGLEKRNEYMFKRITEKSGTSGKGIVFVGLAHIVDIWEMGKFNTGLLSLILKQSTKFDAERCKTYYLYSKEDKSLTDVRTQVERCRQDIIRRIDLIKVTDEYSFTKTLETELLLEMDKSLLPPLPAEILSQYFIPSDPSKGPDNEKQTFCYISSLGGKFLKKVSKGDLDHPYLSGFYFELPVSALDKKAKRIILCIDRVFIPIEEKYTLDYLKENIKTLTIDTIKRPSGAEGFYLTFFNDSDYKGKMFGYVTSREHIDMAKHAIKYKSVIDYLNTLNKQFKWKFTFGENNKLIATPEGYFDNQEGAAIFADKFKQRRLEQVSIKEANGKWHIVITGLEKISATLAANPSAAAYQHTV